MAMKLTEDNVYKLECMVLHDATSAFELNDEKDIAKMAFWAEGVKEMANAVRDAIKELNKM